MNKVTGAGNRGFACTQICVLPIRADNSNQNSCFLSVLLSGFSVQVHEIPGERVLEIESVIAQGSVRN